ncbi:23S rRNA (uracil(1939)-C(5))-methyltransferase RlmD [Eubacterium ruminantium]|uniref:23S rRNA (uracil(1939)-C(5))-methyltransferase RlmD n=1 Tax=Eubacterium ruminantium TaxID=42322 RepID=UPI0015682A35|nr:23S rRNA (uracil(1939)-C(5))-methyltransferase RlmD [Eubacterium ruminantium]
MEKVKCKYSKKCGGCSHIGEIYVDYLEDKEKKINGFLGQYLGERFVNTVRSEKDKERTGKWISVIGMKDPYHYRHKVNAAFGRTAKGEIISGVYEEGSHKIVDIDSCLIENEKADSIIRDIKGMLKSFKIKIYDEDIGSGLLRHVMVRISRSTGEAMVILVVADPVFPSKNNFVKALVKKHPEISTVVLNINKKHTSMVLGDRDIVIYGKGKIKDTLCDTTFLLSPQSFFQINPEMTEKIYRTAIDFAKLKKDTLVIDAYSGIGTISLIAAKKSSNVIGVELNNEAVKDARENAIINKIRNVRFTQGDAGRFMVNSSEDIKKEEFNGEKVVFMDPPRSGSSEEFLNALVQFNPDRIVYISCNPETQARDFDFLTKKGYSVRRGIAFDQFPWTDNSECVCLLEKNGD